MRIGEGVRGAGGWLARLGMMAAVAAVAVGFSVGDASPAPSKDAATTAAPDKPGQEDLHWTWAIPAGKTIEIKGVNGAVRARRTTGNKVDVRAWKHARLSDPAEVTIEFVQHDGNVTVCAVYPSGFGGKNTCEPGEGGHMSTHNNDTVVDFEVQVPAGVGFTGRTVNGSIEAESLDGPILARTVNGHVEVSTSKRAEASTVNGSIIARMGSTSGSNELDFSTVNGSITLDMPETVDADLNASTVNGRIETDFPVTVRGTLSRHRIEGTLGKGGMDLKLQTVNGSIRLRKASI